MPSTLWAHQQAGVEKVLASVQSGRPGYLLAWEMGAGKTAAALEVARRLDARKILVVCPKSVRAVWRGEVGKHWPGGPEVFIPEGSTAKRAAATSQHMAGPGVRMVAVNYDAIWRPEMLAALRAIEWDVIIFDEAHRLKSASGRASQAAALLPGRFKLGLSGTPAPHSPLDVWGAYRALDPSIFQPTVTQFRNYYQRPAEYSEWRDADVMFRHGRGGELSRWKLRHEDELERRIYSIASRVRVEDVLDLPEAIDVERVCELEPAARRTYRQLEADLIAQLEDGKVTAANAMVLVLRLAQITGGTVKSEAGVEHQVSSAKETLLREILEDAAPDPVVVVGRFHSDLDAIHRAAGAAAVSELSGRANELAAWQAGETEVLALQPQAGGLGIDCTRARIMVFYSVGYSLADYLQVRARVHRPGQTRSVEYVHLIAADTVDGDIVRALANREELVGRIVDRWQSDGVRSRRSFR